MASDHRSTAGGFSLVEALVASLLVASAIVSLAHLVASGAERSLLSRRAMSASAIAQSKLEQLQRLVFSFAPGGARLTSTALAPSPPQALAEDTPGFVELVDGFGEVLAPLDPAAPDFARRWAVAPLAPGDADTVALHVCVFVVRGPDARDALPVACASGIRTRQP
jgi:hypothetical protein